MAAESKVLVGHNIHSARHEGHQDLRLNILSSPSTIIKAVLCSAIEYEYLQTGSCDTEERHNSDLPIIVETKLNKIFWSDVTRSIVHEKLEWWLAKSKPMSSHFKHLQEGIYRAGEAAGVYLSRYQRPINAVESLRAKPTWSDKETGFKKYLDKIRENWQVIRDEGVELMKDRRHWGVDPGWRGMTGSRGWWGEIPIKGVALQAKDQSKFCNNALFTCR